MPNTNRKYFDMGRHQREITEEDIQKALQISSEARLEIRAMFKAHTEFPKVKPQETAESSDDNLTDKFYLSLSFKPNHFNNIPYLNYRENLSNQL